MGHKTSGSWDDVTSLGRNDIVFEGRNKAYGAYYVRQRYNYALLLGLLFSLTTVIVGSSVPMLIKKIFPNSGPVITPKDKDSVNIIICDYHPPVDPPKPKPPVPRPPVTNTNPPQTSNNPPVVATTPDINDSDRTARDLNDRTVGTVDVPGDQTAQPPTPPADPGPPTPPAPPVPVMWAPIMPKFHGDFTDYISKNIVYPSLYREANIEGVVYATFVIETDGSVSSVKILKGVAGGDELNAETIKVLQNMPKWDPGQQNGHPVRVQLNLPVKFQLH